jgi:DNA-directed RNA polymerase subunit RPC12/RpoP
MVRGIKTFVCKDCGHKFIGVDIEDNATINSMPIKCPKCGSMHTK